MMSKRAQRGFSLIEVLVALLVIAVGLLGIAGMQAMSLDRTATSRVRALAAVEASNMAAYMAANAPYWRNVALPFSATVQPTGTPLGASVTLSTANSILLDSFSAAPDCDSAPCSAPQMVAADLRQWGGAGELGLLPGAVAHIASNGTEAGVFRVSVGWSEKRSKDSAGGSALAPSTTWYRIVVQP
jgi:type IV pilus assembly protein PilV